MQSEYFAANAEYVRRRAWRTEKAACMHGLLISLATHAMQSGNLINECFERKKTLGFVLLPGVAAGSGINTNEFCRPFYFAFGKVADGQNNRDFKKGGVSFSLTWRGTIRVHVTALVTHNGYWYNMQNLRYYVDRRLYFDAVVSRIVHGRRYRSKQERFLSFYYFMNHLDQLH